MSTAENIITSLRKTLPPAFLRSKTPCLIGDIYSYQTLANLDSMRQGPPSSMLGKRIIYERESFLQWLEGRLKSTPHEEDY